MTDEPTGNSKRIGDPCQKCGGPLRRRSGSFYWRGDSRDAAFCEPCNAIWPIAGEEIEPLRAERKPEGPTST